jgi:CHRD domain-containing protein
MGRLALRGLVLAAVIALLGIGSYAIAGGGTKHFKATDMNGYEENADVSTLGTGSFEGRLSKDGTQLTYELTYSGLEGNVTQSHIHFGKAGVNGGISLWLCQTAAAPAPAQVAATTPTCPTPSGTVTGVLDAGDVVGPAGQLIDPAVGATPGDFAEIIAAMRSGHAYANVHSSKVGTGEIRAQINTNEGNDD